MARGELTVLPNDLKQSVTPDTNLLLVQRPDNVLRMVVAALDSGDLIERRVAVSDEPFNRFWLFLSNLPDKSDTEE